MKGKKILILSVLLGAFLFGGTAKADPNEGALDIDSFLNAQASSGTVRATRYSDYYDKFSINPWLPSGEEHNISSYFGGTDNSYDQRPADSNEPFDIRLINKGTTTEDKTSRLQFSFFYDPLYMFGDNPIIFKSSRLPYGPVVDVRKVINQNSGNLSLIDAPIGTSGIYGTGILEIGTRFLADLDDSNEVTLKDFAIFAEDWQKGPGQYVADICGPNGIPDGYVDNYDLAAFCEDWLKDINDPSTW